MSQANPELQALSQMMMEIESRLEVLHGELQNLQMLKEDVEVAVESMESISTGSTIQVPIGSETYVRASVVSDDEFIIGIGGNYSQGQSKEQTKVILTERTQTITSRMENVSKAIEELKAQGAKLGQQAQEQLSKLQ
jgi:prefoldin alpha subunit|tara:strand:+ start:62 stop:472 length:411 start_codon:yes stop_codon:yes gene_type:complete